MAILVRLLQEKEIGLANTFFNKIYKTNRTIENFRWEFWDCPFGKAIYVVALDIKDLSFPKIIGIQCAIPIELVNGYKETILTAKSEDTLVDPAYRGQKVFERMYELLFEECKKTGINFIWGFTPAKKAFERIGFEIPFMAHQALMVLNPFRAYLHLSILNPANKITDKVKIAGLCFISFFKSFQRIFARKADLISKQIEFNDPLNIPTNPELFSLQMNSHYLEWRLEKNPYSNNYERVIIGDVKNPIADAILNFRSVGYIEQVVFSNTASRVNKLYAVERLVHRMARKVGLIRVLCFDTNNELKKQSDIFNKCGFVMLKRGGYFVWKPLTTHKIDPNQLFLSRLFTQGNQ